MAAQEALTDEPLGHNLSQPRRTDRVVALVVFDQTDLLQRCESVLDELLERLGRSLLDFVGCAKRLDVVRRISKESDVEERAAVKTSEVRRGLHQGQENRWGYALVQPSDRRRHVRDRPEGGLGVEVLDEVLVQARLEDRRPSSDRVKLRKEAEMRSATSYVGSKHSRRTYFSFLSLCSEDESQSRSVVL